MKLASLCLLILLATSAAAQSNPAPFISQPLVPAAAKPGSAAFTLHVSGTNFVSGATVLWNGNALATTFVSSSELSATVPAGNVASRGTATVTVSNPNPGGGISNAVPFPVRQATPGFGVVNSILPVSFSRSVVVGDFNSDHKADLAFSDISNSQTVVLLGKGDGTFQPEADYPAQKGVNTLALGDLNGDGILDLIAVPYQSDTGGVRLGNGDGTFQAEQTLPFGIAINQITLGDMNHDGKLDIVASDAIGGGRLSVLLGNGDGSFQSPVSYAVSPSSGLALGDFNHDSNLDVAIANIGDASGVTSAVTVYFGSDAGALSGRTDYTINAGATQVAAADFDGDGNLDLAVTTVGNLATHVGQSVTMLMGKSDGTFKAPVAYATYQDPGAIAVGDVNGDGKLDIVIGEQGGNGNGISAFGLVATLLGKGDGTFQNQMPVTLKNGMFAAFNNSVALGDFNNDGRLDVAAAGVNNLGTSGSQLLLQGQVQLSSMDVEFGTYVAGRSQNPQRQVKLTNSDGSALDLISIAIHGNDAAQFSQTNDCPSVIPAGGRCTITVTFHPSAAGNYQFAGIYISDNAAGGPQIVKLNGIGTDTIARFNPFQANFGKVDVGTTAGPIAVTLTNVGQQTLHIQKKSFVGQDSPDFAETDNCPAALASMQSCVFQVTFTPSRIGLETAAMAVSDDGGQSPQKVQLKGTGQ